MLRLAAMDLGSNTLRLLVADADAQGYQPLRRALATPRLGRGLAQGALLDPGAKALALEAAHDFCDQARALGASRVVLAATQACRKAADGADFVAQLGRDLGLAWARVISGQEEARLSRLGTLSRLTGPREGALLADVGGGSSELAALDQPSQEGVSLPVGAVSLLEACPLSDPPRAAELQVLAQAVDKALAPLTGRRPRRLVATAGTATTLAALVLGLEDYEPQAVDNLEVSAGQLGQTLERLAALPLEARRKLKGLEAKRADIIIPGLAILAGLLKVLGLEGLTVVDAGLLEGILMDDLASAAL